MSTLENEPQPDHIKRLNRVFAFIDENLGSDLSLDTVSAIAYFSPFHFHRIFKAITGETLNSYVTRRRLERAASALLHQRGCRIAELALNCGFNDNTSFTRAFKKFYGVSPTGFRKQNPNKYSKICQLESKNGKGYPSYEKYICTITDLKKWTVMNAKIEVKEMPRLNLAYVSVIGPQNLEKAYEKLLRWARPKNLLEDSTTKMATIYHDSFKITEPSKVRMSACIILKEPMEVEGEVGMTFIDEGRFIVGSFEIGMEEFEKSWTGLFLWMNENGYKKADRNPFEVYHNDFREHPEKKCSVDFYIPIE